MLSIFSGIQTNSAFRPAYAPAAIAVLPTDPLYEVEIGIAAPRKENRSPAAERFLQFALENVQTIPDDSI